MQDLHICTQSKVKYLHNINTNNNITNMRYQVQKGISRERSNRHGNHELQQVVVEDALHQRDEGRSGEAQQTDDDARQQRVTPL